MHERSDIPWPCVNSNFMSFSSFFPLRTRRTRTTEISGCYTTNTSIQQTHSNTTTTTATVTTTVITTITSNQPTPSVGGFLRAELIGRINAFFGRVKRFGYIDTVLTVDELLSQSE